MSVRGVDVAVPEVRAEAETPRQLEDDLGIGARLAARRDHRPPELNERLRRGAHLEAELEGFALERRRDGQHDVGELRGRIHEDVGVDVKVERRQRGAPTGDVGMRDQKVRAEADQSAHGVRLFVEDRAIELGRRDPLRARGAQRPLGKAERAAALPRRQQLLAGHVAGRHRREDHIAARRVETPRQRVEQRDGASDLRGAALLLDAAPRIVRGGP